MTMQQVEGGGEGRADPEEALTETAELFQAVFNQAAAGIAITGPDWKVVKVNQSICDFLGCDGGELAGRTLRDAVHPDFLPLADEQIRRLVEGESQSTTAEILFVRKNGEHVWGEWTASLIRDDLGKPKFFISVIKNINDRKRTEVEAAKVREMLEYSQRVARIGSWELEIAEDRERWSDEACRIFGLEPQLADFSGYGFLDYVHPDDREGAKAALDAALRERKPYSAEFRVIRPDGTERIIYEYGELEFDDQGSPIRLSGTTQDITERRQVEAELRTLSRRLELAQRQAKVGYWRWSFDEERLTYWSDEAATISQYPVQAGRLSYDAMLFAVHPDDRARVEAEYKAADAERRDFSLEYRVVHKDGRVTHVREIGEVEYDEAGDPVAHVGFVQDISELRQLEQELRTSEQQLSAFFTEAPAGLTLYDREGRYVKANQTIARINGIPPEAHVGKLPSEILPLELAEQVEEANRRTLETGETLANAEVSAPNPVNPDEQSHYVWSRFAIPGPQGEFIGVGAVIVDITKRMRAEQELARLNADLEQRVADRTAALEAAQAELVRSERLATLGNLTATVSHELRNPLGAIRTSLYVIENKTLDSSDEALSRAIERANRGIARCDRIIDELLDYTRIGELDLEDTIVDAWLRSVIEEQPRPENVRVDLKPAANGTVVRVDADRLRRAVINIYDNACHALADPNGGDSHGEKRQLHVQTRVRDDRVELIFTDNGPGISQDVIDKIFEPLFSTKNFGVGLGLPVVRQIMELHDGGIEVQRDRSHGARFTLWLPLDRGRHESEAD